MSKQLIQVLVSGVVLGSIYALMSMGLSLIWGGLRVLNLTQGAFFMIGAYAALWAGKMLALPPVAALAFAFAVTALLGLALYGGVLRVLVDRPDRENATLLATIGIANILENLALFSFGPRNRVVPELIGGAFKLGGVAVTWNALLMTVVALGLLSLLGLALRRSRLGLSIRALAQDRDGAQLSGVGMDTTFGLVMAVSSGLAGVGGVLLSSYYFVSPYVGQTYLLTALIVTVLGGLGSLAGTLGAAYGVGTVQSFVSFYLGVRWSLPVFFAMVIVMLVVRPGGIAGRMQKDRL